MANRLCSRGDYFLNIHCNDMPERNHCPHNRRLAVFFWTDRFAKTVAMNTEEDEVEPLPEFELVWHEPRKPEVHQHFGSREEANRKIVDIRMLFREYTLYQNGVAIDWGFSER